MGADIFFAKKMATESMPMMFNLGNDSDAEEHATTRFIPLLRSIPDVRRKFTSSPHDVTKKLIRLIDDSFIVIQGVENPKNFDGKGICYLVNDDCHKAKKGNLGKAKSRTGDFRRKCKIMNIAQGGVAGDDMDIEYRRGTQEAFGFRCPKCDRLQAFEWRTSEGEFCIKWDKNETTFPGGRWNYDEMAKTIRYECSNPDCDQIFRDTEGDRRIQTYDCGEFLPPANPFAPRDTVSITWNQLCVPWVPWKEIVIDWIEAMEAYEIGDSTKLMNFIQRRLAQNWEDGEMRFKMDDDAPQSDYELGDAWPDEKERFLSGDVQQKGGRHIICVVRAFAEDGRSRALWAGRLESFEEVKAKQEEFQILGKRVGLDCAHDSSEVEAACAKYGWIAMLGNDGISWPWEDEKTGGKIQKPFDSGKKVWTGLGTREQAKHRFCWRFLWSRPVFSDILQRRLSGKSIYYGVPGDIAASSSYRDPNHPDEEKFTSYWPQMRSWQKINKRNKETGVEKPLWTRIGKRHDHYRSAELMALVMAGIAGCLGGESHSRTESQS